MAGRRTNLAILIVLAWALATGGLAFGVGGAWTRWVVAGHGTAGLALILLAPWKTAIARRGLRRARRGRPASIVLGVLIVVCVLSGVLHATGILVSAGFFSVMQMHVASALVSVPFAGWHVVRRPVPPRRTDLSRRNFLRAGALAGGAAAAYVTTEGALRVLSLPGAERRSTGSYEVGSLTPATMPVTQWLDDRVPPIDPLDWALEVGAGRSVRSWSYGEIVAFDDRLRATIDCTGGWYGEQDWEGAWIHRLIPPDATGRSLLVRSVTGYPRRFPLQDLSSLFLATSVGGRPLDPGHGFPARIVAPGRRGFWWVKWVRTLEVSEAPWWWQPPFPLT